MPSPASEILSEKNSTNKSNTNQTTNHQSTSTSTSLTTTDGISTTLEPKSNWPEKTVTTTLEFCSTPAALLLTKPQRNKTKSNNKSPSKTSTTTTAKSQCTLTRTANQSGWLPNSSSLNKTPKSPESDSPTTMKPKKPIDSRKETQAPTTQVPKSTASSKPSATRSENSSKVSESITLYSKMLPTSQSPTNTNSIWNGSRTLSQSSDSSFVYYFHLFLLSFYRF